jgi:hypothetical protein
MEEHFEYLKSLLEVGRLILAGLDPPFGIIVLEAESEEEARRLIEADPSVAAGVQTPRAAPLPRVAAARPVVGRRSCAGPPRSALPGGIASGATELANQPAEQGACLPPRPEAVQGRDVVDAVLPPEEARVVGPVQVVIRA